MKLNELIEKYGEYEIKEGFLNFLEQPKPKTIYDLKKGDKFYCIKSDGADWLYYVTDNYVKSLISIGNAFLTKEEAEFEFERLKVIAKLKKFAKPFEHGKDNWFIVYDWEEGNVAEATPDEYQTDTLYFKDGRVIDEAITYVGDGDYDKGEALVKKYYLRVGNSEV